MTIGGNHTKIRNKGLAAKLPTGYLGDQMDKLGKKVGPKPMVGGIIDLAPLHDGGLPSGAGKINIVDQLPKEPRFKKAGPKGQYDRRILLSEHGTPPQSIRTKSGRYPDGERIVEYHATKGWRSYRAA